MTANRTAYKSASTELESTTKLYPQSGIKNSARLRRWTGLGQESVIISRCSRVAVSLNASGYYISLNL